jgi:undecaprenyl-diphosphatase
VHRQPAEDSAAVRWFKRNANYVIFALVFFLVVFPRVSPWEGLNDNLRVFQRLSEWALDKVENLFDDYGYYVVFVGVLIENSMFLGLLVPGAIILILAGLAAENGSINIWYVFALAIVATIIGDTVSYVTGRMGWARFIERTGMGAAMERVRGPMRSHTAWIILSYHLAGYSRVVGPLAAGLFRVPFRRWAPLDYAGGTIWVLLYTGAGILLGLAGVEFGDTKRMVQLLEWFFLALFAIAIAVAYIRTMRTRGGGDDDPAPGRQPVNITVQADEQ